MIGLVLVTHGHLANEFIHALEHVVGKQQACEAISIGPDDRMDVRRADIAAAVDRVNSGEGVIVLTDMFGGTPTNIGSFQVPLFIGFNLGNHQLVLSPRAAAWMVTSYGSHTIFTGSGGLGVSMLFDVGRVELAPELCWQWSPIGLDGAKQDPDRMGIGGLEAGFGISW